MKTDIQTAGLHVGLDLSALITDISTFFFFLLEPKSIVSSIHYHPSVRRPEENDAAIHPEPLTQIPVINFAVMMEEMSVNQSSIGRRVWEPSTSAHLSAVKMRRVGISGCVGNVLD